MDKRDWAGTAGALLIAAVAVLVILWLLHNVGFLAPLTRFVYGQAPAAGGNAGGVVTA